MTKTIQIDDRKLLKLLAIALVENQRANLQELAKACDISKATLYRFCQTRELLINQLGQYAIDTLSDAIHTTLLQDCPPKEALRNLAEKCLENQELLLFIVHFWNTTSSIDYSTETKWLVPMDRFFLRGQEIGVFRIDITAAGMSELWINMLAGLFEAERRGRVARVGLINMLEITFLQGVLQQE
ncbi:transcriptional regulator NfxB [Xenorhabdus mauleonii]|uniref:Transcriptional regulator NfxB n=1 Tax=Xenorhabdus mauleonii TaxID=351675 RepID=A0A1I3VPA6_9GAMM|nr:TetR/AcrR family transcriptional regulator [Xenorhabdus mauleonii]PHM37403.1 transcriptional regulator NfxB [Xenorhabdus mauleonii]SFJ96077.1 transcriptional regulator, RpiR family [Xenorhabdus mauleonii]